MSVQTEKFAKICVSCISGAFMVVAAITTVVIFWVMLQ